MPKADKSKSKTDKKSSKKSQAKGKAPAPAEAVKAVSPAVIDEDGYRLAEAARRLGPGDRGVEAILRLAHPDAELQAEGTKVASDRILEDGRRLCSKALIHLESSDPEVKEAARKAGLTRPLMALTVDALQRLAGAVDQHDTEQGKRSDRKQNVGMSLETATAQGRALKRQTIERLKLLQTVEPALATTVTRASARAQTPEELSAQLSTLAEVVAGLTRHSNPSVRSMAAFKGIGAGDEAELTAAVDALAQASTRVTSGATRREEKQAVLDVLDGLCLLLLDDVLRALRAMARFTPKVHKPRLYGLASYFGARGKAEEEPEEPPAPAPAPV